MEDRQIIQLYWNRDEQAIQSSIDTYGSYCQHIANTILTDRLDVEEAVADTWLQAWNAIPPQWPEHLRLFLGRLTRNLALSIWRRNHAQSRGGGQVQLALEELGECVGADPSPEALVDTRELARCVSGFLQRVPLRQRQVFLRRYFYLEDTRTIARLCGMGEGAVRMTLSRLRKRLREHLIQEGYL